MEDPPILANFNDGHAVPVQPVHCGECGNEWLVPAYSDEWMPSYCCYCGIRFARVTTGDDPNDFRPHRSPGAGRRSDR